MALANTTDYGIAVNQILYYIDNNFSGIDRERLPIYSGMLKEDFATLIAAYATYKTTRDARPTDFELHPDAHGVNETTTVTG